MGLTLPSDLFPVEVVGSVTGLGTLVDRFSYFPAFVLAALMPIPATWSIVRLLPAK